MARGRAGETHRADSCGSLAVRQREPCGSPVMVGAVAGWTVTRPAAEGLFRADPQCSSGPPPYPGELTFRFTAVQRDGAAR